MDGIIIACGCFLTCTIPTAFIIWCCLRIGAQAESKTPQRRMSKRDRAAFLRTCGDASQVEKEN